MSLLNHTSDGIQYSVHLVGEPTQNAIWMPGSNLNIKAQKNITDRPSPAFSTFTTVFSTLSRKTIEPF